MILVGGDAAARYAGECPLTDGKKGGTTDSIYFVPVGDGVFFYSTSSAMQKKEKHE